MAGIGSYDHPNALVRQIIHVPSVAAGASGDKAFIPVPVGPVRIRNVLAYVTTAGTTSVHGYDVYNGTTSVGTISLGTGAAASSGSSGDINVATSTALPYIKIKSKTDATGTAAFAIEWHHDQGSGTWS